LERCTARAGCGWGAWGRRGERHSAGTVEWVLSGEGARCAGVPGGGVGGTLGVGRGWVGWGRV